MVIVTYSLQGSPKIEQLVLGMYWPFMIRGGFRQTNSFTTPLRKKENGNNDFDANDKETKTNSNQSIVYK